MSAVSWAASSVLSSTYGYVLSSDASTDLVFQSMKEMLTIVSQGASSSQFLVNLFPALMYVPEWMPGAGFKAFARKARQLKKLAINAPFDWVKAEMVYLLVPFCYIFELFV